MKAPRQIIIIPLLARDYDAIDRGENDKIKLFSTYRDFSGAKLAVLTNRHRKQRRAVVSVTPVEPHRVILKIGDVS